MQSNEWTPPYPLRPTQKERIEFPLHALPPPLANFISAIATNTCTDPAMATTSMLSALSYTMSGLYRVYGKKDHSEPITLYSIVVSPPASMKSPVISLIKQPFDNYLERYNSEHLLDFYQNEANRSLLYCSIKQAKKSANYSPTELADLIKRYNEVLNYKPRSIFAEDITPQKLALNLEYDKTLLILSAESGMLENFNMRYDNSGPNIDLLLKSYSGESYISSTIKRGDITLNHPYLSIGVMTQPYLWDNIYHSKAFRQSGLLARFIYCFPYEIGNKMYNAGDIPDSVADKYYHLVYQMLDLKFNRYQNNSLSEISINLSDEARRIYEEFFLIIQKEIKDALSICQDWAGKYHGLILRIAGLLHVINSSIKLTKAESTLISVDEINDAIIIGEYYKKQTIIAYQTGEASYMVNRAEDLLRKIKKLGVREIKQNELLHHVHCKLYNNARELNEVIEYLIDFNYIQREEILSTTNNRNGWFLRINPYLFE